MSASALISPEEAWSRLQAFLAPLPEEQLARRRTLGRVLAQDLVARVDVPFADVSAMDGYAFDGTAAESSRWPVAGTIAAGDAPGFELPPGTAAQIMTGAPVPSGADRVIPVELTRAVSPGTAQEGSAGGPTVDFQAAPEPGAHVRRCGEIIRRGEPLLAAGTLVTPGALAQLATHGYQEVPVHRAPRLAILPTGDEVVPPNTVPGPGQLRDSHTDFLMAACRTLGLEARSLSIAPDEPVELRRRIEAGLGSPESPENDVLLLTGGVSMGEFDLVEGVLAELGCEVLFEKVAVQPAKPVVAAIHPRPGQPPGIIFGLPGNPASAMVAFWLFVRPALRRLLGSQDHTWHGALAATLDGPLPGAKDRSRYLPAEVRFDNGRIFAKACATLGSHDLSAYARGTALVKIPAGSPERLAGEPCEILPLADWRGEAT